MARQASIVRRVSLAVCLVFFLASWAYSKKDDFDHSSTGFPLTGAHQSVDCAKCHINGVFKNTPRDCAACHNGSIAPGKPENHIPTTAGCDTCHTTESFKVK